MICSIATLTKGFKFNLNDCLNLVYPYLESDTFGTRLRKIRKNNNLTTSELSKIINISTSGIISYENSNVNPSPNIIIKLYKLFGNNIICNGYMKFIAYDCSILLELWRTNKNISKKEASKILGISENTYLNCVNKKSFISEKTFKRIKNKIISVL
ncbi:helix-turn-helix transcriptional regulator [Clostridium sp. WILCCON 0269]|uniref:Helix-turn-helix transcriptional regulator n=1 Tax=Candidatus Clostridium eludens TaxID=3381663 RepID=A0ABW8SRR0_9CLOT